MDDRYEIRGKIGQGGIGAVYAGYDKNLNREVAIKRIVPESTENLEMEASRQMAKEAAALSKLQHPNIVTVYDVGLDKDGPFVVMELLHGKTIEEVVAKATFTWNDFRELALQTHEALIAAQDMNMVHRDLKPTNVMLNWLPSGKFQVKIVDFGLAKFSPKPSLQTIDQKDSIFGSIFFMAPEQFERTELDARTDMYAIGCVFYYALTGTHPFNGDTGPQVMLSHLDHRIFPLHEVRPDLPRWVADWVMWHINRLPEHRPSSAREALALFIQSEKNIPTMPVEHTFNATHQGHAGSVSPASPPTSLTSALRITAPQPILPPEEFGKPSVHSDSQPLSPTGEFTKDSSAPVPEVAPSQPVAVVAPPPLPPPPPQLAPPPPANDAAIKPRARLIIPSSKPTDPPQEPIPTATAIPVATAILTPVSVSATPTAPPPLATAPPPLAQEPPAAIPVAAPIMRVAKNTSAPAIARPVPTSSLAPGAPTTAPLRATAIPQTQALSHQSPSADHDSAATAVAAASLSVKKIKANQTNQTVLIIALILVVTVVGGFILSWMGNKKETKRYNELMVLMKDPTLTELPVNKSDLELLLSNVISLDEVQGRETLYKAVRYAVATDGTDVDTMLTEFTTQTAMSKNIRDNLLRRVLGARKSPKSIGPLIDYSKSTNEKESAAAALAAIRETVTEEHLPKLLDILLATDNPGVRKACEEAITSLFKRSTDKNAMSITAAKAYETAKLPEQRRSIFQILGTTGTPKAKELLIAQLTSEEPSMQIAAATAARNWPNDILIKEMIPMLGKDFDPMVRNAIFDSCISMLKNFDPEVDDKAKAELWKALIAKADTTEFQLSIINTLATIPKDWSLALVQTYTNPTGVDRVIDRAEKAMNHITEKMKKNNASDSE